MDLIIDPISWDPYMAGIFTYIFPIKIKQNVGKYTYNRPMDPMVV